VEDRRQGRQAPGGHRGLKGQYDEAANVITRRFEDRVEKLERGDELPPGVLKMVKVFVAVKRKLQPATRWPAVTATRASSAASWPIEDMAVPRRRDACRHRSQPAGVPSRMNVGQIFETHLGWASRGLGRQIEEMLDGMHERWQGRCRQGT
jgi:DNA-directed RNA polymerase subunit beta